MRRAVLVKGLRLHWAALSNPAAAVYPCIFVNGRAAPLGVVLDQFELGDIEAVEVYGPETLQHDRLVGKFAASPPTHLCGAPPDRSMGFAPSSEGILTTMRVPLGREPGSRQMISALVIWLRQ